MKRRKKRIPIKMVCRNCNTSLQSRYCHNCGQDVFAGTERTVIQVLSEMIGNIFTWDNKILSSLKYLIFFPGKLTKEYLSGRIASYVNPYKIFWFVSILLFAVLSFRVGSAFDKAIFDAQEEYSAESKSTATSDSIVKPTPLTLDNENPEKAKENTTSSRQIAAGEIGEDVKERQTLFSFLNDFISVYMPYIMFLLFPFFALLMRLFFRKKLPFYTQNLIFSVHVHAFMYIYFTLVLLAFYWLPPFSSTLVNWVLVLLPAIYILRAVYVVYKPRKRAMLWKIPFISFIYLMAFLAIVITIFVVLMKYKGIIDELDAM